MIHLRTFDTPLELRDAFFNALGSSALLMRWHSGCSTLSSLEAMVKCTFRSHLGKASASRAHVGYNALGRTTHFDEMHLIEIAHLSRM